MLPRPDSAFRRSLLAVAALTLLASALALAAWRAGAPARADAAARALYASPLVSRAPDPQPGDWRFDDGRGWYARAGGANDSALYVNSMFTRAGASRSGDIHTCEQLNHVVFGTMELTLVLGAAAASRGGGREAVSLHRGGAVIRIPPHTPHLFTALEDSVMTEAWRTADGRPCAFAAWYYAPLRGRVGAQSLVRGGGGDGGSG